MNKMFDKIKKKEAKPLKITKENFDEYREDVLKTGKKFKYPMQYAKHKVLVNTVVISVLAIAVFSVVGWFELYRQQTRSDFFFMITKVAPLQVAEVDGEPVLYDGYLLRLRSSIHYLRAGGSEVDIDGEDGVRFIEHLRRQEMNEVQRMALTRKLARELDLKVSEEEIDKFIEKSVKTVDSTLSLEAFEKNVLRDLYGQDMGDFRWLVRDSLLKNKVMRAIDTEAEERINNLHSMIVAGGDFTTIIGENSDDESTRGNGGKVELALVDGIGDVNGIIEILMGMKVGEISGVISGVDGYYIVRLDSREGQDIVYSILKVAFKEFDRRFEQLHAEGKIREFIEIAAE